MKRFAKILALALPLLGFSGLVQAEPPSQPLARSVAPLIVERSSVASEPFSIDAPQSLNLSSREMNALRLGAESDEDSED